MVEDGVGAATFERHFGHAACLREIAHHLRARVVPGIEIARDHERAGVSRELLRNVVELVLQLIGTHEIDPVHVHDFQGPTIGERERSEQAHLRRIQDRLSLRAAAKRERVGHVRKARDHAGHRALPEKGVRHPARKTWNPLQVREHVRALPPLLQLDDVAVGP